MPCGNGRCRNFLVTLFFSQGIPMLLAGDELGRTQGGNNNSYCQDNEISWVDWDAAAKHADLVDFVASLSALRKAHPVFRRRRFFSGQAGGSGDGQRDIIWLSPAGHEMAVRGLGHLGLRRPWRYASTATRSPSPGRAASGSPTRTSSCCSTRTAIR